MPDTLAARFYALFAGSPRAHGLYTDIDFANKREDGKVKGKAVTVREPVTEELWQQHLDGKIGIGISPLRDDSTCYFGAIDVDVYKELDPGELAARTEKLSLPLILCRTKSGGAHLYIFTKEPVAAAKIIDRLREMISLLGLRPVPPRTDIEIFPNKATASEETLAQWINVPYQDVTNTRRYAVDANGDRLTAERFLDLAERRKVDAAYFDKPLSSKAKSPIPDAPPCLQSLMTAGFPEGTWDVGTFNLGIYCRQAYPEDWANQLIRLNGINFPPDKYPVSEVQAKIKSVSRAKYRYECDHQVLQSRCDQMKCRQMKYGIGGGLSGFPTLKHIQYLGTRPPVWILDLELGEETYHLDLLTEELMEMRAFSHKCGAVLRRNFVMPGKNVWQKMTDEWMRRAEVIEAPEEGSKEGQFWELLDSYCTDRAQADTWDSMLTGKPYTEDGRTYFMLRFLLNYLRKQQFRDLTTQEITKLLKTRREKGELFCTYHRQKKICGRNFSLWSIKATDRKKEAWEVPNEITEEKKVF